LVRLSGGRSLQANNAEVFLPALRAGLGLALQPDFLVWQDLRDGTLESVLDDWQGDPLALHIVTPPGRRRPARVQALVDYLAEGLVGEPWAREVRGG
jgi:DNA-binding transcriptional LysR family regulator